MLTLPVKTKKQPQRTHVMRARYDAAQTSDENRKLWGPADGYSADTANNVAVRTILRNRSRYVFANNPRARGMMLTLATHTVGTGPRLQMMLGAGTQARKLNEKIETSFRSLAREIRLAQKLRICRLGKVHSGEIFPIIVINPNLAHESKLDLQLVETDQVHNPRPELPDNDIDGIFFDAYGNPEHYRVLKNHPGAAAQILSPNDYKDYPARSVLHYYGQDRPGQHRGIPEITPAVQLVEEGRRFRSAVLAAAETAADFAIALESDASANVEDAEEGENPLSAMDTVELPRRLGTVLPRGFKLTQTRAEQPTTTYKEFSRELLAEVARCLQMPVSIASLDANDANMSSSYVINQPYEKAIDVERDDIECAILDPLLDAFLTLAFEPLDGGAPLTKRVPDEFPHEWFWPLIGEHADPGKMASAQETRLKNRTTTYAAEYARKGEDWEKAFEQIAKENARMKELGITPEQALPGAGPAANQQITDKEDDEEEAKTEAN